MENIKIAHLSDLHAVTNKGWGITAGHIVKGLVDMQPNIVVVSGDMVDQPLKRNYKVLNDFFIRIQNELKDKPPAVIIVPGNHDYYYFGCRIPLIPIRVGIYNNFEKELYARQGGKDSLLIDIARKYRVCFFLIDSNLRNNKGFLAQGEMDGAESFINEYMKKYEFVAKEEGIEYQDMVKIVVLHHHPLPLAVKYKKEEVENYLSLNNAYKLLHTCKSLGVNLILHGHKHTSGLFGLKMFDRFYEGPDLMSISSCSSTGKLGEQNYEMVLMEVSPAGSIHLHRYVSEAHGTAFKKDDKISIRYYGDIRKARKIRLSKQPCGVVKNVENKTKIVSIKADGNAYITVALSGILWKEFTSLEDRFLIERIRSDMGRVPGGYYEFQKILSSDKNSMQQWSNPAIIDGIIKRPEAPEAYDMMFNPYALIDDEKTDCFKLDYLVSSGFALTCREHKEKYKEWVGNRPRQEMASISVNYPIDSLELIVAFPEGFFPLGSTFNVEAYKKERIDKIMVLDMLYGRLPIEDEERRFLVKKGAVRIRPENNEVSVIIKYPRTDLEYVLRWDLPFQDMRIISNYEKYEAQNNKLSESVVSGKYKNSVNSFYDEITSYIKQKVFIDADYNVFLLGYDQNNKLLKVIGSPDYFSDQVVGDIIIGRGPAGKAFLTRTAVFWCNQRVEYRKKEFPSYPVEEIVYGLNPKKVFAVPLIYPALITEAGGLMGNESWDRYIYPSWGCISIASCDDSSFTDINHDVRSERFAKKVIEKYVLISKSVKDAYGKYLTKD